MLKIHISIFKGEINAIDSNKILKKAMELPPLEKAEFIDKLLSSLDEPDRDIDELWSKEAEDRIEA